MKRIYRNSLEQRMWHRFCMCEVKFNDSRRFVARFNRSDNARAMERASV